MICPLTWLTSVRVETRFSRPAGLQCGTFHYFQINNGKMFNVPVTDYSTDIRPEQRVMLSFAIQKYARSVEPFCRRFPVIQVAK